MTFDDTAVALAETASRALRDLDQHGAHLRPVGVDRFGWSADLLDELARAAELLGQAVEHATGVSDVDVTRRAHDLATAVVAHRNALLRDQGGGAPFRPRGDRPDGAAATRPAPPRPVPA